LKVEHNNEAIWELACSRDGGSWGKKDTYVHGSDVLAGHEAEVAARATAFVIFILNEERAGCVTIPNKARAPPATLRNPNSNPNPDPDLDPGPGPGPDPEPDPDPNPYPDPDPNLILILLLGPISPLFLARPLQARMYRSVLMPCIRKTFRHLRIHFSSSTICT